MSNIILVGPASPFRGGIADLNEAFALSLVKNGHKVEIISFTLQYPKFLFPGKTQFRKNPTPPSKYKITSLINSINPINWFKTANYIIKQKPDKVFIRFWMPFFGPSLGWIAKRLTLKNIPVFSIVDNAIPHEKRWGDKILTNYFIKKCNKNFTLSDNVKLDIQKLNPIANTVALFHPIYNTFNPKPDRKFALKELKLNDNKFLLFFGLIRSYKGLHLAIEAMSHPSIKELKIKLLIAGEFYENQEKYETIINDLKLENIIIVNEFISQNLVPHYFSVANAVVLPYTSATQSGITQLAMNYECPMIVTNVGGLPEVIDNNKDGIIVEPNVNSLANGILQYFNDPENEFKMSELMRVKKNNYSWDIFTKTILAQT